MTHIHADMHTVNAREVGNISEPYRKNTLHQKQRKKLRSIIEKTPQADSAGFLATASINGKLIFRKKHDRTTWPGKHPTTKLHLMP